jgi:UDPglucose 6-dehydrogenase
MLNRASVVGLGKLGACLAACLAQKGFKVIGVDVDERVVHDINAGNAPVIEPGLTEMIAANRDRLSATHDYSQAVLGSDVTFVVVPTPSEPDGTFSLRYVNDTGRKLGQALAQKNGYHLVVLTSTVLPGSTERSLLPLLENGSGKRCGVDFGLCYNPEFIALGEVIQGMLRPELLLIGESDVRAGDLLEELYSRLLDNRPGISRMNFVNAELAKISINTYVTMKITFANVLADLCERVPGGDVDAVTKALGIDSRIGPRYLRGGLGFGGPCFPRDTVAFSGFARQLGGYEGLSEATGAFNRQIASRVVKIVKAHLPPNGTVAVLGLAYKPGTPVVEESQGIEIAQSLAQAGASVRVYDPIAGETARKVLGQQVHFGETPAHTAIGADVLVIANPLPELRSLVAALEGNHHKPLVVIDCWRFLPALAQHPNVHYLGLGFGPSPMQSVTVGAGIS